MEEEKSTKVRRSANFTSSEKHHLLNLIANKYRHIIEDKKTDRSSVTLKNATWRQIEMEFNASSPNSVSRSAECLKKFYDNRKKDVRKQIAEEKKQRMLTGGGPMPIVKKDSADDLLISIMNEKTIHGLQNNFDSDSIASPIISEKDVEIEYFLDVTEDENATSTVISNITYNEDDLFKPGPSYISKPGPSLCSEEKNTTPSTKSQVNKNTTWKHYGPADLKSPINPVLIVNNNNTPLRRNINSDEELAPASPATSKRKLDSSRRRPTKTIRTLTSSDVSQKYNLLLDKRLVLVEKQIQQLDEEQAFRRQEQKLKIELLQLEIESKRRSLEQ